MSAENWNDKAARKGSMIFYESFYNAIETLQTAADRERLYKAIIEFGLFQKEPDLPGHLQGFFMLIRPQLEANWKRYEGGLKGAEYGTKGGRPPKNETPKEPPENPPEEPQKNPTKTPNVNVNANGNGNVNGNGNGNGNGNESGKQSLPTLEKRRANFWEKCLEAGKKLEASQESLKAFFDYWSEVSDQGHKMKKEKQGTFNTKQRLQTWLKKEQQRGPGRSKIELTESQYMAMSLEKRSKYQHPVKMWGADKNLKIANTPGEAPKPIQNS